MPTESVRWRGKVVETLPDYLKQGLRAVFVGINPSLVSVEAGHYYQGRHGRRFWKRLLVHGVIQDLPVGREDEAAFKAGFGFTDVVKKPSASAKELDAKDYEHGRQLALQKLLEVHPQLVCFVYKRAAEELDTPLRRAGISTFRCPGPYTKRREVGNRMEQLRQILAPDRQE